MAIVNVACLLAVTTVSVAVWAVNNSKTVKSDRNMVTVIGDDVSAEMSAGKQVSGGIIESLSGTVGGDEMSLTDVDLQNLSSFTIGDITVLAGGYVNVWFTVENLSADAPLNVAVSLTDGADNPFSNENVTTEIYGAYWNGDEAHITDINNFLTNLNMTLGTSNEIATDLLAYDIEETQNSMVTIPEGAKKSVIVRYDIGASAVNFDIGINLTFSV